MDAKRYLTCLWPGLSELWYRGRAGALPAAVAFAAALNFLLVARFLYPEWLAPPLVKIGCWLAALVWAVSVVRAVRDLPRLIHPRSVSGQPDPFPQARQQYLRGHWIEAETLLTQCLDIEPRDPPALLLLAGVYRQTARLQAAAAVLDQLDRMEAAESWWLERRAERARLARSLGVAPAEEGEDEKESPAAAELAGSPASGSEPPISDSPPETESGSPDAAADDRPVGYDSAAEAERATEGATEPSAAAGAVTAEAADRLIAAEMAAFRR